MLHEIFIHWILSSFANWVLAIIAMIITFNYIMWIANAKLLIGIPARTTRIRMISRSLNWFVFGLIFMLFDLIIQHYGLLTWRATARTALFFLMLSELVFQVAHSKTLWKEMKTCKLILWFQSLLL
jgi:hypothetical protein